MSYKKLSLMKCMLAEWLHIGRLPTHPRKTYLVEWIVESKNSSVELEVREYDSLWCALKKYWEMSRANSSVGLLLQDKGLVTYEIL